MPNKNSDLILYKSSTELKKEPNLPTTGQQEVTHFKFRGPFPTFFDDNLQTHETVNNSMGVKGSFIK